MRTSETVQIAMADGGFDPVAIQALSGDTIGVGINLAGGGTDTFRVTVPAERPPVVVRTASAQTGRAAQRVPPGRLQ